MSLAVQNLRLKNNETTIANSPQANLRNNETQTSSIINNYPNLAPLEKDTVSFSGKGEPKVDTDVEIKRKNIKKEASTGKKWGVGIASAFVPGLGQGINGQWGKAAGFFFGSMAAGIMASSIPFIGFPLGLGLGIWSIVDAVKNAKSDVD